MAERSAKNTDREIWRANPGDYYADSIHVTEGEGIGMNCGGHVIVKPIREWHKLGHGVASEPAPTPDMLNNIVGRCLYNQTNHLGLHARSLYCEEWKAEPAVERPTGRPDLMTTWQDLAVKNEDIAKRLLARVRELESELSSLRRELANRSTNELWYASERQKLEARVEELKAALQDWAYQHPDTSLLIEYKDLLGR